MSTGTYGSTRTATHGGTRTGTDGGTRTGTYGGTHTREAIGFHGWKQMWYSMTLRKRDMNRLILRSLANEGYDDAVKKFITEAGPESGIDMGIWTGFLEVQKDLQSGNVDDAMEKLKNLNPAILNNDDRLLCVLLLQEFIELIRTGKVAEALEFCQERLAPVIKKNPSLFEEFAQITSLLSFKDDPESPAVKFLDTLWRSKTANEVKEAIFRNNDDEKGLNVNVNLNVNIMGLLKELKLVQKQLDKFLVYPRIKNFHTAVIEYDCLFSSPHVTISRFLDFYFWK